MSCIYQEKGLSEIWDRVSVTYDSERYWQGPENIANLHHLLLQIGELHGKKILEVGCGSGLTSLALAQEGAECALLDISPQSLQKALEAFAAAHVSPPVAYNTDALASGLPPESFDIVWNGGVIEHFVDEGKLALIREMHRLTKPGGKTIIMAPNAWCWQFQLAQAWQKLNGTWSFGFEDDVSPRKLRQLCRSLGLKGVSSYAFNPVLGWRWVPIARRLIRKAGLDSFNNHSRESIVGFISVLVIQK